MDLPPSAADSILRYLREVDAAVPGLIEGLYAAGSKSSIAVRGPEVTGDDIWFDADTLRRWNLGNLDNYWVRQVDQMRRIGKTEDVVRHEYLGIEWLVLGVPRLHYTIATLDITSKTGAGEYALGVADNRWHQVIETSIALRADRNSPLPASPEALSEDAAEVATWFIEDAHRLVEG